MSGNSYWLDNEVVYWTDLIKRAGEFDPEFRRSQYKTTSETVQYKATCVAIEYMTSGFCIWNKTACVSRKKIWSKHTSSEAVQYETTSICIKNMASCLSSCN